MEPKNLRNRIMNLIWLTVVIMTVINGITHYMTGYSVVQHCSALLWMGLARLLYSTDSGKTEVINRQAKLINDLYEVNENNRVIIDQLKKNPF